MRKRIKNFIDKRFVPHWIVLLMDMTIIASTFIFTYFLRFNLFYIGVEVPTMFLQLLLGLPFYVLAVLIYKPHHGIIRHSSRHEVLVLLKTNLLLSSGFLLISISERLFGFLDVIPWSVILVNFSLSTSLMITTRLFIPYLYQNILNKPIDIVNVMIYGAGVRGSIAHSIIMKDNDIHYRILGFIDDNPQLWNRRIEGLTVFSPEVAFENMIKEKKVQQMFLAISSPKIKIERKREIADKCLAHHLKIKEVTTPSVILDNKFANGQFRDLRIEDLLGREPILSKMESISIGIFGKRVMVTGGAGSIGSEIIRQLVYLQPKSIILVDQSESAVFDIQNEIMPLLDGTQLQVFVADTTNERRMKRIFETCQPQLIFHAAAYKHVPLMEMQANEAIYNNIGGTKILADLAISFGVEKFLMISTDKAVNPTNIMGATKRICEIYIQSLSRHAEMKTKFITTRFGNVLGSNGSVIPIFKRQIHNGGPVTITHRDIIRYFMTIPEACNLVLEATLIGKGGEILLFDMGTPVRIFDLAERMISLSGLIPHEEIKIIETGLRPGEKLYEELLVNDEECLSTSHDKIMIRKIRPYNYKLSEARINELLNKVDQLEDLQLVAVMKEIVPEFVSINSPYESTNIPQN